MEKMSYAQQLKHPNWQRKRLGILERDGFECSCCGDKETTLHVHHKKYIKGRMAWDYEDDFLETLCDPCHKRQHASRELLDELIACNGVALDQMLGLAAGYLLANFDIDTELAERISSGRKLEFEIGIAASTLGSRHGMRWRKVVIDEVLSGRPQNPIVIKYAERWQTEKDA